MPQKQQPTDWQTIDLGGSSDNITDWQTIEPYKSKSFWEGLSEVPQDIYHQVRTTGKAISDDLYAGRYNEAFHEAIKPVWDSFEQLMGMGVNVAEGRPAMEFPKDPQEIRKQGVGQIAGAVGLPTEGFQEAWEHRDYPRLAGQGVGAAATFAIAHKAGKMLGPKKGVGPSEVPPFVDPNRTYEEIPRTPPTEPPGGGGVSDTMPPFVNPLPKPRISAQEYLAMKAAKEKQAAAPPSPPSPEDHIIEIRQPTDAGNKLLRQQGYESYGISPDGYSQMILRGGRPTETQAQIPTPPVKPEAPIPATGEDPFGTTFHEDEGFTFPKAQLTKAKIASLESQGWQLVGEDAKGNGRFKRMLGNEQGSIDFTLIAEKLRRMFGREPTPEEVNKAAEREVRPGEETGRVAQFPAWMYDPDAEVNKLPPIDLAKLQKFKDETPWLSGKTEELPSTWDKSLEQLEAEGELSPGGRYAPPDAGFIRPEHTGMRLGMGEQPPRPTMHPYMSDRIESVGSKDWDFTEPTGQQNLPLPLELHQNARLQDIANQQGNPNINTDVGMLREPPRQQSMLDPLVDQDISSYLRGEDATPPEGRDLSFYEKAKKFIEDERGSFDPEGLRVILRRMLGREPTDAELIEGMERQGETSDREAGLGPTDEIPRMSAMDEMRQRLQRDLENPPSPRPRDIVRVADELAESIDARDGRAPELSLELRDMIERATDVGEAMKNLGEVRSYVDTAEDPNIKAVFENLYQDAFRKYHETIRNMPQHENEPFVDKFGPQPEIPPPDKWDMNEPPPGQSEGEIHERYVIDVWARARALGLDPGDYGSLGEIEHAISEAQKEPYPGPHEGEVSTGNRTADYKESIRITEETDPVKASENWFYWRNTAKILRGKGNEIEASLAQHMADTAKQRFDELHKTPFQQLQDIDPNLRQEQPLEPGRRSGETIEQRNARWAEDSARMKAASDRNKLSNPLWREIVALDNPKFAEEAHRKATELIDNTTDKTTAEVHVEALEEWMEEAAREDDFDTAAKISDLRVKAVDRLRELTSGKTEPAYWDWESLKKGSKDLFKGIAERVKNVTAKSWAAQVEELDARNAPDYKYRDIMSTAAKNTLKRGETWRGRVIDGIKYFVRDEKGAVSLAPSVKGKKGNKKGPSVIREAYNFSRGITTTMDLSASMRQGLPLITTKEWWTSWKQQRRALGSEGAYQKTLADIKARPLFQPRVDFETGKVKPSIAEEANVKIMDVGENLNAREEATASNWVETGGMFGRDNVVQRTYKKTAGRFARATNRAYTAYLNQLRADSFEALMKDSKRIADSAMATGEARRGFFKEQFTPEQATELDPYTNKVLAKQIGDTINTLTGRGPLRTALPTIEGGKLGLKERSIEQHAKLFTDIFFSPRLIASRVRMLNPMTYMMADPFIRKQYLKGLLSVAGAWGTFATLGKIAGGDINTDTNSADFGKVRFGNVRLDPAAGFQQYLVAASRLITGKYTSSARGTGYELGQGIRAETRGSVAQRFATNKLHPVQKFANDMFFASQYRPVNMGDRVAQMFTPLIIQDVIDIWKEDPTLLPLIIPAALGMGTQTYEKGETKGKIIPSENDWIFEGGAPNMWQ